MITSIQVQLVNCILSLSYVNHVVGKSAADYYVQNLPGLPFDKAPVAMHAGHIEVTPAYNGKLFFWHFQKQQTADRERTVVWLNGGPACSSEDGALMEIGPYRLDGPGVLRSVNGSWNEYANLLFVDNPVGTGYSTVDFDGLVTELPQMAIQFVDFLDKFLAIFPEYSQNDIYLAGESYAGQHIPYIAKEILDRNRSRPNKTILLSGLLLGNAWISPKDHYNSYVDYALEKELIRRDSEDRKYLFQLQSECNALIHRQPDKIGYAKCEKILKSILSLSKQVSDTEEQCYNMYDVRLRDSYPSCGLNWPPDLEYISPYLRNMSVTKALHTDNGNSSGWEECKIDVGAAFRRTTAVPSIALLPSLLEELPILLFSGGEDLICNYIGTERLIKNLRWGGFQGLEIKQGQLAPHREWMVDGETAGLWQEARNLTYVHFYNASHMVPFDWPRRSQTMLNRFMGVKARAADGTFIGSQVSEGEFRGNNMQNTSKSTTTQKGEPSDKSIASQWQKDQDFGGAIFILTLILFSVCIVGIFSQNL